MKKIWIAAICTVAVNGSVWAGNEQVAQVPHQHPAPVGSSNATSNATSVGISSSQSTAGAVAISGQGGQGGAGGAGGRANSRSNATGGTAVAAGGNVSIGGAPATTSNVTSVHNSGSVSNVPAVFAPGLAAAGLETCLGSVSVGASWLGTGLTGGGSIPDPGCAARLDSRTLWAMGLRRAAVARLCLQTDIYRSMPEVCALYIPVQTEYGVAPVAVRPQAILSARAIASANDGSILLVNGKTGKEQLCNNYDAPAQKCMHWDGQPPMNVAHRSSKPRNSIASKKPAAPAPAVAAGTTASAVAAAEPKKD